MTNDPCAGDRVEPIVVGEITMGSCLATKGRCEMDGKGMTVTAFMAGSAPHRDREETGREEVRRRLVRDVMTSPVVTVPATAPVKVVAEVLFGNRVSAVPVVDPHGKVVGMISEADLLVKELAMDSDLHPALFERARVRDIRRRRDAETAAQLMSVPVVTVHPETPLRQAAKTMLEKRIKRLPVVSAGWLVGIVSRVDLVRVYLLPDEELRRQGERLISGTLGAAAAAALQVEVREGVVIVAGEVATHSEADLIPRLMGRLEGVVAIESRVTWRHDDVLDAQIRQAAHLEVTPPR